MILNYSISAPTFPVFTLDGVSYSQPSITEGNVRLRDDGNGDFSLWILEAENKIFQFNFIPQNKNIDISLVGGGGCGARGVPADYVGGGGGGGAIPINHLDISNIMGIPITVNVGKGSTQGVRDNTKSTFSFGETTYESNLGGNATARGGAGNGTTGAGAGQTSGAGGNGAYAFGESTFLDYNDQAILYGAGGSGGGGFQDTYGYNWAYSGPAGTYGAGKGGLASYNYMNPGDSAIANTGSGGGGGAYHRTPSGGQQSTAGGNGGSGIIIIRTHR